MGGKSKQSQRTKNNVRPSSSGRSAELLSGGAWALGADVGITAQALPLFPTLTDTVAPDQSLNADFLLCIKKLNKKDPVTKIKALQELAELVINCSEDDIKSVLPHWTRSYQTLSTDVDHKVREATQTTHGRVCARAGRALAPQLRRLMPTWLAAQFDPYAPAAAAAHDALTNTFPESKLPEVLSFCKTELMTTICDNLFANVEVSLMKKGEDAGSGGVDAEAERGRRERMLCGALRSLCCVCALWGAGTVDDWLATQLVKLFDAPSFWKIAANPVLSVKAAWVCALGQAWTRCGVELRAQYATLAERALLAIAGAAQGQRSPLLVRSLADCFANFTASSADDNQQDWTDWIQNKDDLCKKIFIVIENGGWGDAQAALALARALPAGLLATRYKELFRVLLVGLESKTVVTSRSERQAWLNGIEEGIRRASARHPDIALNAHRSWLELVLGPKLDSRARTHIIQISATAMASLLVYWMRQSLEHPGEEFDRLTRNFWHNLGSTLLGGIEELIVDHTEIENRIDAHALFLRALKTPFSIKSKKQSKVRFENDQIDCQPEEDELETSPLEDSLRERYRRDLRVLVSTVCSRHLKFSETKEVPNPVFARLIPLLREFNSTEFFVAIAGLSGEDENEHWTPYQWYQKKLIRWLAGDTMRCRPLAELVLMVVPHLASAEQVYALSMLETLPPAVVEWCVRFAVSHPHCERPPIRDWLRGATAAQTLVAACRRFTQHGDDAARDFLLLCLARHHDEVLVNEEAVDGVLMELTRALKDAVADMQQLERVAALAARLAPIQAADTTPPASLGALLCAMFDVNLKFAPNAGDGLVPHVWEEVRSTWQAALGAASSHQRQAAIDDILHNVRKFSLFDECQLDVGCIKRSAELCRQLVLADAATRAQTTAVLMQPAHDNLAVLVETFTLRLDTLTGRLSCPLSDCEPAARLALVGADPRPQELDRSAVLLYIRHLLFRALYLRAFVLDVDPNANAAWGDSLLADDVMRTHFLQLLRDFAVLDTLHRGYGFWPHYELIEECHEIVTKAVDDIVKDTRAVVQDEIYSELANEAVTHGYYWALARKYFGIRYRAMAPVDWLRVCDTNAPPHAPPSGFYHNLQVCCEESEDAWEQYRVRWACAARAWAAAHGARPALQPRLARALPDLRAASLDLFIDCYYADNDTMLYDRELSSASWTEAAGVGGVASAMCALVAARGADMPAHHWDFVNISLCSLVNSVRLSAEAGRWPAPLVTAIARPVLELADRVAEFVEEVPTLGTRLQLSAHVAALPTEWRDVFAPDLYANLLSLALTVLESGAKCGEETVTATHVVTVCALVRPIRRLRWTLVGAARRAQDLSAERLAAVCGAAFAAPAHPLYLRLAYFLLHCIIEPLFKDDVEKLKVWTDNENADDIERPRFSLHYLEDSLRRVQELADAALDAVTAGETTCEPAPASAAHRAVLAHLLLSERLLNLARRAHDIPDLMEHYIAFFRGNDYIEKMLGVCLRLMPARLLGPGALPHDYAPLFTTDPDFVCTESSLRPAAARAALTALACRCLYLGVGGCGAAAAAARGWWGAAPARLHRLLQRLVGTYVTPALVRAQLGEVAARASRLSDTELIVHLSTRELECCYSVDERPVRLRLQLSDHHPLGAPRVDAEGAPDPNLLSLAVPLAAQNGSVWRALRLWRARLLRHVESAPVCYVCYMRLHPDSGRLPRQRCAQCRNKFHHECLQKWFTTSKKMECPLCRAVYKS